MVVQALPVARALLVAGLTLLAACSTETGMPPSVPTDGATTTAPQPFLPTRSPFAATAPPLEPTAAAAATYRAWMEEARLRHPYSESVDAMWAVMICESSGNAAVVAGEYHGLFQYRAETWGGAWNPYRDQPILDPRAQILATAKAWQDGNQAWWGCSA